MYWEKEVLKPLRKTGKSPLPAVGPLRISSHCFIRKRSRPPTTERLVKPCFSSRRRGFNQFSSCFERGGIIRPLPFPAFHGREKGLLILKPFAYNARSQFKK